MKAKHFGGLFHLLTATFALRTKTDTADSSESVSILLSKTLSSEQRRGVLGQEGGRGVTGRVKQNSFPFDILLVQSRYIL